MIAVANYLGCVRNSHCYLLSFLIVCADSVHDWFGLKRREYCEVREMVGSARAAGPAILMGNHVSATDPVAIVMKQ